MLGLQLFRCRMLHGIDRGNFGVQSRQLVRVVCHGHASCQQRVLLPQCSAFSPHGLCGLSSPIRTLSHAR